MSLNGIAAAVPVIPLAAAVASNMILNLVMALPQFRLPTPVLPIVNAEMSAAFPGRLSLEFLLSLHVGEYSARWRCS
jgi:hypothetical protein